METPPVQPTTFTAPEGAYTLTPTHFPATFFPTLFTSNGPPAIPAKVCTVSVWYPPKKEGGLGGLLGIGGGGTKEASGDSPTFTSAGEDASGGPGGSSTSGGEKDSFYGSSVSTGVSYKATSTGNTISSAGGFLGRSITGMTSNHSSSHPSGSLYPNGLSGSGGKEGIAHHGLAAYSAHPRPRSNVRSTSSSFVTRVQTLEGITKLLAERAKGGEEVRWMFWNLGRVWGWVEVGCKAKEPLTRITFAANITCHSVSHSTARPDLVDVFIGFSTGDIVWIDPTTGRYSRLNKAGIIHPHPVLHLIPHPASPSLLFAVHQDGCIFVYSLDREDPVSSYTIPWDASSSVPVPGSDTDPLGGSSGGLYVWKNLPGGKEGEKEKDKEKAKLVGRNPVCLWRITGAWSDGLDGDRAHRTNGSSGGSASWEGSLESFEDGQSGTHSTGSTGSHSARPSGNIGLSSPASGTSFQPNGGPPKKNQRKGGTGWAFRGKGKGKGGITAAAISPDGRSMGVCDESGLLRVIDVFGNRVTDVYAAYFGSLTCLAWSPDSRFLLIGGQDDLISVISIWEERVVARCQGHSSFVTGLNWDPDRCEPAKGRYRFGSVGEDGKILLWDFTPALLRTHHLHHRNVGSTASLLSPDTTRDGRDSERVKFHHAPKRNDVPVLQAVCLKIMEACTLTEIHFVRDAICLVSRAASIRFFARPPAKQKSANPVRGRRKRASSAATTTYGSYVIPSGSRSGENGKNISGGEIRVH
ncbi:WD40 protein DMR-N9 [Phaffia rhodozyma]|uniref:WD40 protein DMR-N9 n=1 Tax=Phaffia rhodozyma TaxID=264483 RepID=A0A0F7SYV8_PHARH|nr:WD40 protein DMR-N9 [Phaffia rhodozyma]